MAFIKKTWKARTGTGLNKYRINGQVYTLENVPDEVVQAGDVATADTMNDLESRIKSACTSLDTALANDIQSRSNEDERIADVLHHTYLVTDSYTGTMNGFYVDINVAKSGYTPIAVLSCTTGITGAFNTLRSAYMPNSTTVEVWAYNRQTNQSITVIVLFKKNEV